MLLKIAAMETKHFLIGSLSALWYSDCCMGVTGSTPVFPALTQSWKKLLAQEQRNSLICLWKCEQGWDLFVPHKAARVPLWRCHFLFDMVSQIMLYLGHQIMWPFYLSVLVPSLSHSPKDLMLFTNTHVLSHCVGFQFVANLISVPTLSAILHRLRSGPSLIIILWMELWRLCKR